MTFQNLWEVLRAEARSVLQTRTKEGKPALKGPCLLSGAPGRAQSPGLAVLLPWSPRVLSLSSSCHLPSSLRLSTRPSILSKCEHVSLFLFIQAICTCQSECLSSIPSPGEAETEELRLIPGSPLNIKKSCLPTECHALLEVIETGHEQN